MFKFWLLIILVAQTAMAQELMYSSSSVPEGPWTADLPMEMNKDGAKSSLLRIKVFPHDLRNDHLHGKRDDKTEVKLVGKINLFDKTFKTLDVRYQNESLKITADDGVVYHISDIELDASQKVQILRKGNEDKSHSYHGKLRLVAYDEGIMIINTIDIEQYLRGVVPKESVPSWPLESLKAQTLAARSYAYYHKARSKRIYWDVDDTERFQVYAGVSAATAKTDRAIFETRGEVMTYKGKVITAFFHAYSGGRTDSAKNIFGNHVGYCIGNEEIFSREELKAEVPSRSHWVIEWTTKPMSRKTLVEKMKQSRHTKDIFKTFDSEVDYSMQELDYNLLFDSIKTLQFSQGVQQVDLNFVKVRSALGWSNFPAYHFRIEIDTPEEVLFKGHGWGHHVGMSQWGAMMMAKHYAKNYREILHHYYHNVQIENLTDF